MQIDITDENGYLDEETNELLGSILQFVAKKENIHEASELSVVLVKNEAIQQLNNDYRHKNEVTDVLSFPLYEREEVISNDGNYPLALGDIVISYDRAIEQAEQYGHSIRRELAFLSVHGLLHLLGYTHDNEKEEKVMFTKQEVALKEFGLERK